MEIPEPPEMAMTATQVAEGEALFHTYCSVCHGPGAISSGGGTPDLSGYVLKTGDTMTGNLNVPLLNNLYPGVLTGVALYTGTKEAELFLGGATYEPRATGPYASTVATFELPNGKKYAKVSGKGTILNALCDVQFGITFKALPDVTATLVGIIPNYNLITWVYTVATTGMQAYCKAQDDAGGAWFPINPTPGVHSVTMHFTAVGEI